MPTRRNSRRRRGSLDAALAALPARFYNAEVCTSDGSLSALHAYVWICPSTYAMSLGYRPRLTRRPSQSWPHSVSLPRSGSEP